MGNERLIAWFQNAPVNISEALQKVVIAFDKLAVSLGLDQRTNSGAIHTRSFAWFSSELGFELQIDTHQFFIFLLIVCPVDGVIPVGMDDFQGRRFKLYLHQALDDLGSAHELRALQKMGNNVENCDEMLRILTQLLENHWRQILANRHRWFR